MATRSFATGEIIRIKSGSDGDIYTNIGEPLPEERAILSGPVFEPDEIEEMREEMEEVVQAAIEHEASYRVPAAIIARYFRDSINSTIVLTRYRKG